MITSEQCKGVMYNFECVRDKICAWPSRMRSSPCYLVAHYNGGINTYLFLVQIITVLSDVTFYRHSYKRRTINQSINQSINQLNVTEKQCLPRAFINTL